MLKRWREDIGQGFDVMIFSHMLDIRLRAVQRFNDVSCLEEFIEKKSSGDTFHGYVLGNCFSIDGDSVVAGIDLHDGGIVGVSVLFGEKRLHKEYEEELFIADLENVLRDLTRLLEEETTIGSSDWIELLQMSVSDGVIKGVNELCCKKTNYRITQLKPVLLDAGTVELFCSMLFGFGNGRFVVALANQTEDWDVKEIQFEAVFESQDDGNSFFKKVANNYFISKKGNKIFKLEKEDFFELFSRVPPTRVEV